MPSRHEIFWTHHSYAVVGHGAVKPFPKLTYGGLKARGKRVFPIDRSAQTIDGDVVYQDFASLPEKVEAAVLEVPREETREWVDNAAQAGITQLWIHMNRDTPEALALAREKGITVHSGTCAVMYLRGGFHSIHKWINKLSNKY